MKRPFTFGQRTRNVGEGPEQTTGSERPAPQAFAGFGMKAPSAGSRTDATRTTPHANDTTKKDVTAKAPVVFGGKEVSASSLKNKSAGNSYNSEKPSGELTEVEYDAAFGDAMPVPYNAVSIALDFGLAFSRPVSYGWNVDTYSKALHERSLRSLLGVSNKPGAWRDAVVCQECAWAEPEGPLFRHDWNLSLGSQLGTVVQSAQHFPERLVYLQVSNYFGQKIDQILQQFVRLAPNAQRIGVKNALHMEQDALLPLQQLPLTSLWVDFLENSIVEIISKLTTLTELRVSSGCQSRDISHLAPIAKNLQKLKMPLWEPDPQSAAFTRSLTNLRELEVDVRPSIYGDDNIESFLDLLPQNVPLEVLVAGSISAEDAEDIARYQKLREFRQTRRIPLPISVIRALGSLPRIKRATFCARRGEEEGGKVGTALAPAAQTLTFLSISGDVSLQGLPRMPLLQELEVPELCSLTGILRVLKECVNLTVIRLGDKATQEAVAELRSKCDGDVRDMWPASLREVVVDVGFVDEWKSSFEQLTAILPQNVAVTRAGGVGLTEARWF